MLCAEPPSLACMRPRASLPASRAVTPSLRATMTRRRPFVLPASVSLPALHARRLSLPTHDHKLACFARCHPFPACDLLPHFRDSHERGLAYFATVTLPRSLPTSRTAVPFPRALSVSPRLRGGRERREDKLVCENIGNGVFRHLTEICCDVYTGPSYSISSCPPKQFKHILILLGIRTVNSKQTHLYSLTWTCLLGLPAGPKQQSGVHCDDLSSAHTIGGR
jgi:hypothetical protein